MLAGKAQVRRRTYARLTDALLASHSSRPLVPPATLARLAELDPFARDLYVHRGAGQAVKMSMFSFLATGIKKYYDIGETLGKGSFGKLCTWTV